MPSAECRLMILNLNDMTPQQLEDRLIGFAVMSLGKWLGLLGSGMQPLLGLRFGAIGEIRMEMAPCSVNPPAGHREVFFCQCERLLAGELCFGDRALGGGQGELAEKLAVIEAEAGGIGDIEAVADR